MTTHYSLLFSDESGLDIRGAYLWYESRRPGLGEEFESCLEDAFYLLTRSPRLNQIMYKGIRVHYISRFPYGIHYLLDELNIRVMAVFHTSRNPSSWDHRLDEAW